MAESNTEIEIDPIFKGCTRPAMKMGIPLVPLAIVIGVFVLIALYTSLVVMLFLPLVLALMRLIVKQDDQQFRLLWLRAKFRFAYRFQNESFWKASAYSPIAFKKRKQG
jgi:type IV secretion system protein VirB3/type IV secretion system protein PtlB